jgi:hypothetical protein
MKKPLGPLVCARKGSKEDMYPDNLHGKCCRCGTDVVYRPHNAFLAARVTCYECYEANVKPGDIGVATGETLTEVNSIFGPFRTH